MKKDELIKILEDAIKVSDKKWDEGQSPAYCFGYLQGEIKAIIKYIKDSK